MTLSHGGNLASATGYVTYRCQTLDGCTIDGDAGPNGNSSFWFQTNGSANYVIIDGFVMLGAGAAQSVLTALASMYGIGTNGAQIRFPSRLGRLTASLATSANPEYPSLPQNIFMRFTIRCMKTPGRPATRKVRELHSISPIP